MWRGSFSRKGTRLIVTYDNNGFIEPGFMRLQVKASESLHAVDSDYVFDVDIRDYNLWMMEDIPVILVLFDATQKRAYWVDAQDYFLIDETRQPRKGAKTVRIRVPIQQTISRAAIADFRELKLRTLGRMRV